MRRAVLVKHAGKWQGDGVPSVTLPYDERHRRRIRMTDDGGEEFLLDLADAVLLVDGDGLILEGGGVIAVRVAPEAVLDIQCRDAAHAARVAWHIGNRHTAVQVLDDGRLRIAADHVMADMITGLGAGVSPATAPFEPEGGAYSHSGGHHGHDH